MNESTTLFKIVIGVPWLAWVSGLSASLLTKRSTVWFPGSHMPRFRSPVGGKQETTNPCISHTLIVLFLSFSLCSLLSKSKQIALAGVALDWAPACEPKGCWFNSQLGTCLGCGPGPQLGICEKQLIYVSLAHRCFSPSISPFLSLSLEINK